MMWSRTIMSVMHFEPFTQFGNVPCIRGNINAIFVELQLSVLSLLVENTAIISWLKRSFNFQFRLLGSFVVRVVDQLLGTHNQQIINAC